MFQDLSGNRDWALVYLDEPLEWQLKVGEPFQFRLACIDHFLIKSRWQDHRIGDAAPTSVFILLVEKGELPQTDNFDVRKYVHVAWGMCSSEPL